MLQIFYKEKPIIISDNISDLKESLVIDLELIKNIGVVELLNKKKVKSIGVLSKNKKSVLTALKKKYPEIIAAGGKVINQNSEIIGLGLQEYAIQTPLDILNNNRTINPDLGAYQHIIIQD